MSTVTGARRKFGCFFFICVLKYVLGSCAVFNQLEIELHQFRTGIVPSWKLMFDLVVNTIVPVMIISVGLS